MTPQEKSSIRQRSESPIDNDQAGFKPRLLDQVPDVIRCQHYSIPTITIYTHAARKNVLGVPNPLDRLLND